MSDRLTRGVRQDRARVARVVVLTVVIFTLVPTIDAIAARDMTGTLTTPRDSNEVQAILTLLKNGALALVPEKLFAKTYNPELVDLVVFFDRRAKASAEAKIALVSGGKTLSQLRGTRQLWVVVLVASELRLGVPAETTTTRRAYSRADGDWSRGPLSGSALAEGIRAGAGQSDPKSEPGRDGQQPKISSAFHSRIASPSVWTDRGATITVTDTAITLEVVRDSTKGSPPTEERIYRLVESELSIVSPESTSVRFESLGEHRSLSETGLALSLGTLLGYAPRAADPGAEDKSTLLQLQGIGESGGTTLFWGMHKIGLKDNSIGRVRVAHGNRRAYKTFGTYGASRLGAGIGVIGSTVPDTLKPKETGEGTLRLQPYLFFDIFLVPPSVPRFGRAFTPSLAITGGTEIKSSALFDNLFLGVSLGRLLGDAGIVVGVNHRRLKSEVNGRRPWNRGFSAGFTYAL